MLSRPTGSLLRLRRLASTFASIDGVPADAAALACSFWDQSFQRGDGVFEAVRVVIGSGGTPVPRAVGLHLDRLERSAAAIRCPLPARSEVERYLRDAAAAGGEGGYVRLVATRGGGAPGYGDHLGGALDAPPRVFTVWQPLGCARAATTLAPAAAPWHPAGTAGRDWATIKWLAYGANMHSARLARAAGFGDALLLGRGWGVDDGAPSDCGDRVVLDGPNFAVCWFKDGVLCAPSWRDLGMLESCTSALALRAADRAGVAVDEGVHRLRDLERADEVYVLSTGNDFTPVSAVGGTQFPASAVDSPSRVRVLAAMDDIVRELE